MDPNNGKGVNEPNASHNEKVDVQHQEYFADRKDSSAAMAEEVEMKRSMNVDEEHHHDAKATLNAAQHATDGEHKMTLREGLRKYPAACGWSLLFSSALM